MAYDDDGNGVLSFDEFEKLIVACVDRNLPANQIGELFDEVCFLTCCTRRLTCTVLKKAFLIPGLNNRLHNLTVQGTLLAQQRFVSCATNMVSLQVGQQSD